MVDGSPYRRGAAPPSGPPCPGCGGGALAPAHTAGVAMLECASCRGRWLPAASFRDLFMDPRACRRLLEALAPEPGAAAARDQAPDAAAPGQMPGAAAARGPLACPHCGAGMSRRPVAGRSGPPVALCRSHGLWFGRGQLRAALARLADGALASELEARDHAELASALLDLDARPRRRGLLDRALAVLTRRVRTLR